MYKDLNIKQRGEYKSENKETTKPSYLEKKYNDTFTIK